MRNQDNKPIGNFESFEDLFQKVEQRPGYWIELAKLDFTEELLGRMKELGMSKSQLAEKLGVNPAFITKLVSGHNNFTLETMVRIACAVGCEFRCHLQPAGTKACWIDILKQEPERRPSAAWPSGKFGEAEIISLNLSNESVPITA